jgi:hypothetical protein
MVMSIRLLGFVLLLMPGWLALLRYYIFDALIIRNIEYGKGSRYRNVLDVYLPRPHNPIYGKKPNKYDDNGVPVVVFVSGGAWIIGYKLWSALMGREFARRGYVVIVPDYRNFPQGNIEDMMEDLREALRWTVCNCAMFGGDSKKIVLAGQSAGAHISLCTIIELYENSLKRQQQLLPLHHRQQQDRLEEERKQMMMMTPTTPPQSYFPHVDTATVLISSSLLEEEEEEEFDQTDHTDIDQSLPSESSSGSSPGQNISESGGGDSIWWDVETPTRRDNTNPTRDVPLAFSEQNSSMEILWDESRELLEPLSDGPTTKTRKSLTTPVDLREICTPSPSTHSRTRSRSGTSALPLEINLLGSTDYASDVITDTAKQNVDDSIHDLDITDITLFIGISGPYNMVKLLQHLHYRGLDASILHHVFNSNVSHYSPVQRLNNLLHLEEGDEEGRRGLWDNDENILKQTYNQFYSYLFNVSSSSLPPPSVTTSTLMTPSRDMDGMTYSTPNSSSLSLSLQISRG